MGCGGSKDPTQPDPGSVQMRGTDAGAKDTDAPGTDVVGKEASAESRMTAPDVHEGEAEGEANATVAEPEGEAEGEKVDEQRYTGAESIWAALKEKHVRLIKSSWIVEHNKTGNPLPRRQELPEEAFISVEELKRQYGDGNIDGVLPIIGISFCWDTAPNPDPRAKQLKTVAAMLEQERPKYAAVGFTEMGVFWDVRGFRICSGGGCKEMDLAGTHMLCIVSCSG